LFVAVIVAGECRLGKTLMVRSLGETLSFHAYSSRLSDAR
jgi:hypothetical protein